MSLVTTKNRTMLAAALLPPFAGSIWLLAARSTLSSSTFAAGAALMVGIAAIALTTWRRDQATGSIGQLIQETYIGASPVFAIAESRHAND